MGEPVEEVRKYDLIESLAELTWYKLPYAVMRDVDSAALTLCGLARLATQYKSREVFAPVTTIAAEVRTPVVSARRHLKELVAAGWLEDRGRERNGKGIPRRTCTLVMTDKARAQFSTNGTKAPYGVLPYWAVWSGNKTQPRRTRRPGKSRAAAPRWTQLLPWSARAVLSVVLSRLMTLKVAIDNAGAGCLCSDDYWGSIANMGDEDRFRFTLDALSEATGLTRESAVDGKRVLEEWGIIVRGSGRWREDGADEASVLYPNPEFQVWFPPASEGRTYFRWGVGI